MNPNTMACPTQQQLTAFVAGKLNETESAEIEQHLAECESCCQVLKLLPDESTLVALLSDKAETAAEDSGRQPSSEAATIPPTAERRTVPPSADMTEIAESPLAASAASIPEPLKNHGRYRILQLLGRGGMGDVYKAHHRMMNRTVALKVINGQLVSSHAAVQRFHREVQAAARLSHPNIVAAYDAEQAGDTHFLVMEFVEGTDLATLVRQRGPLPVAEACEYIRQAAEGLEHAHRLGMVHRDIKPQNLMLSQLRIADWGFGVVEWDGAAGE
jgi:serine/threonine protein kinase